MAFPYFQQASRRRGKARTALSQAAPRSPAERKHRRSRGVALIIALVSITLLTVVATEFAYNSRVDLQLAANQRDEVRAYYMARSGLSLGRLLLRFQKQVDQTPIPNPASILGALTGGGANGAGGANAFQPQSLNLQLWKLARVDCHMLKGLVKSDGAEDASGRPIETEPLQADSNFQMEGEDGENAGAATQMAAQMQRRSFGGFEGCFLATISDEEEKLNVTRLNATGGAEMQATAARLLDMFSDKRFEFLWQQDDANHVRSTPMDTVIALKDWADDDTTQSTLNVRDTNTPFVNGFADEGSPYSRYEPRYDVKNARFDSLDELYRVHGVNDRFMAAFRDRLTVYPNVNSKPNINTDDPIMLGLAIMSAADPNHPDPRLTDPVFLNELISRIRAARMFNFFGMSVSDFLGVVEQAGIAVNPLIKGNVQGNRYLSDKSKTFTIKSVGEAGSVQKTLTAVIRLDDGLGKLVYYREE
ncbi:general secretion pathway protein GspK [Corallococcus exiguus]|uniref:type II secretion system protein GspK n=1 Tax=Corallococcus TaxID=83461 RepID=UPI000EA105C9|nr:MULTISPECIES: type II secretion system protein GspK [Corallococcus]NRD54347.1 general secretion pathway protein GspK [Corallococcus exiguus]NRD61406.1 general secretion pathway protein GspK [Corallococcus exiguus]RKH25848.1 general secretion pathway protein GspK [Corallococcus sp. CA041A]RKI10074.1 general secretion pathway protein GspK [Corallococcus sp. AB030]RUO91125.1 general secretion pathway protein GspK [Corallococcus sp. AB018]